LPFINKKSKKTGEKKNASVEKLIRKAAKEIFRTVRKKNLVPQKSFLVVRKKLFRLYTKIAFS